MNLTSEADPGCAKEGKGNRASMWKASGCNISEALPRNFAAHFSNFMLISTGNVTSKVDKVT